MQARSAASRRPGARMPSLARAHPPCTVDALGAPDETDLAEAECSGHPAAATSTRGVGRKLAPLAGGLAGDAAAADAPAAASATVEASATPCRLPSRNRDDRRHDM